MEIESARRQSEHVCVLRERDWKRTASTEKSYQGLYHYRASRTGGQALLIFTVRECGVHPSCVRSGMMYTSGCVPPTTARNVHR
jgi:hypothetical protein